MRNTRLALLAMLALFAAGTAMAGVSTILTIDEAKAKQPGVAFDHSKHAAEFAKACDVCHHTHKGLTKDSTDPVKNCAVCHLDPKDEKIPSMREMSATKNPFHIRCIGCHKEQKKGPASCTACHHK
jgi:Class III cytochrome C family